MRRILTLFVVALSVMACSSRPRIIPDDIMSEMYVDIFMVDEWLLLHAHDKEQLDTSLVYGPVFSKYGYNVEDYKNSVSYYMEDPDKYARIMKNSLNIVDERIKELERRKAAREDEQSKREALMKFAPKKNFRIEEEKFSIADGDSIFVSNTRKWELVLPEVDDTLLLECCSCEKDPHEFGLHRDD